MSHFEKEEFPQKIIGYFSFQRKENFITAQVVAHNHDEALKIVRDNLKYAHPYLSQAERNSLYENWWTVVSAKYNTQESTGEKLKKITFIFGCKIHENM